MLLSHRQNAGQNRNIKNSKQIIRNVSQFKYLGATVTNKNLIQVEIKRKVNSGNACYNLVQNFVFLFAIKKT
jgi:hypothetical protein